MKLTVIILASLAALVIGCVREPYELVAVNKDLRLQKSFGEIQFDIEPKVLAAKRKAKFDLISFTNVRDSRGKLECHYPEVSGKSVGWVDPGGKPWVKLKGRSKVSYVRTEELLVLKINDLVVSKCELRGRDDLTLHVFFDARPQPFGWDGEGLLGFDVSLPNSD